MIAWLSGKVIDYSMANLIVLDVNGVGYAVETTTPNHAALSQEVGAVNLYIHTIVREDAISLYGFLEIEERSLFKSLIKVNGIGPKSAIAILSTVTPSVLIQSIHLQDKATLTKLPGVGKKTAERLLIEMQDILKGSFVAVTELALPKSNAASEALAALEALGYKRFEALESLKKLQEEDLDAQGLIKKALQLLVKH